MIHIQKKKIPDFLSDFIERYPSANYDSDLFKPYRTMLRKELIKEQRGLCAYCCSKLVEARSHNEHIEPRHKKDGIISKRSLDYVNIVVSCDSSSSCGNKKGNAYDERKFISPLQDDCENWFSYDPDGTMNGDEYTISLLNLNSYKLKNARKAVYKALLSMNEEAIRQTYCSDNENYSAYSNVIFWFLRNLG